MMSSAVATATLLPGPARRRHEEADLQRSVHHYLSWSLPPDAVHFAVPNGLMRSKKAAARAQGEGVMAGIPDLCVVHRGRAIFIELKAARGVVSAAQRAMMGRLYYSGAEVVVCKGVPEVQAALLHLGVPLKALVAA
jgi:hypothetical protein